MSRPDRFPGDREKAVFRRSHIPDSLDLDRIPGLGQSLGKEERGTWVAPRNKLWEPNTLLSPGNNRNTSSVRLHVTVRKCFPRFRVKGLIKQTSNSQTLTKDTELIFTDFLRVHKLQSERTYTVGAELLPVSRGRPRGTTAKIWVKVSLPHVHLHPQLSRAAASLSVKAPPWRVWAGRTPAGRSSPGKTTGPSSASLTLKKALA